LQVNSSSVGISVAALVISDARNIETKFDSVATENTEYHDPGRFRFAISASYGHCHLPLTVRPLPQLKVVTPNTRSNHNGGIAG